MLKNLILSAAAAGVAAGLLMATLQAVTTTPLILAAERYETGDHDHAAAVPAAVPAVDAAGAGPLADEWAPEDGIERTLLTSLSTVTMGIGFGLALLGVMVVAGVRIDARRGLAFGAAGFAAVALAPALGLPPEIPGSAAAALEARQAWWFFAVAATGCGLAALLLGRPLALRLAGAALIALPHIVGAPQPPEMLSTAPAELAGQFVAASLAVTAVFWAVLGFASGAVYERLSRVA
jgi:cobalt transporter subunit CbtA